MIDKNECLACMQIESSYVRLVVRQVAWYYGLNVMSRFETSIIKGPEYNGVRRRKTFCFFFFFFCCSVVFVGKGSEDQDNFDFEA